MSRNVLRLPLFVLVCGFLTASHVFAETVRVELYDGTVSFVPPEGFSRLSDPDAEPGTIVYANEGTTVFISILHPPQLVLEPQDLPQLKAAYESALEEEYEELEWVKKELIEAGGRTWIHLESMAGVTDTKIHQDMYATSRDNRLLVFDFDVPVGEYDAYRGALEQSRKSIVVNGFTETASVEVYDGTARVELYGGTVSFIPPKGFSRLSDRMVATKFPGAQPGSIVYTNERVTVSINISHPPERGLKPQNLSQLKAFMESSLEQREGFEWMKKEIIEVRGRKWIHLESVTREIDTTRHNVVYVTSRDGRGLIFTFHTPFDGQDAHRDALEQSRKSIILK